MTSAFFNKNVLTVKAVLDLVSVYQSDAILRDRNGLNVRVGQYIAPTGSEQIKLDLEDWLRSINESDLTPHEAHHAYEKLHPFTDGNGRSGRAIWA